MVGEPGGLDRTFHTNVFGFIFRSNFNSLLTYPSMRSSRPALALAVDGPADPGRQSVFHYLVQGGLDTAGSLTEQGHALAAQLGDRESVAIALPSLGMVATAQGACDKARRMLRNVLDIAVQACNDDLR